MCVVDTFAFQSLNDITMCHFIVKYRKHWNIVSAHSNSPDLDWLGLAGTIVFYHNLPTKQWTLYTSQKSTELWGWVHTFHAHFVFGRKFTKCAISKWIFCFQFSPYNTGSHAQDTKRLIGSTVVCQHRVISSIRMFKWRHQQDAIYQQSGAERSTWINNL